MDESIGGPPCGHLYTAEEVRVRLERAKETGEFIRDSKGIYRLGASGHSGFSGIPHDSSRGSSFSVSNRQVYDQKEIVVKQSKRFSIRAFIREGTNDLKAFFKPSKKEKQHAE